MQFCFDRAVSGHSVSILYHLTCIIQSNDNNLIEMCILLIFSGAVDGTLIPIKGPSEDEHLYIGRKGFHCLNVQVICDHTLRYVKCITCT